MSAKFDIKNNTASDYIKAAFTAGLAAVTSVTLAVGDGSLSVPELLGVLVVVLTTAGAALGLYSDGDVSDPEPAPTVVAAPTVVPGVAPEWFSEKEEDAAGNTDI